MVTVTDLPALIQIPLDVEYVTEEELKNTYGMLTFLNPASSWLGTTTELRLSVTYTCEQ
jgi:hypothetical protein